MLYPEKGNLLEALQEPYIQKAVDERLFPVH
jgi:hypothetical protein